MKRATTIVTALTLFVAGGTALGQVVQCGGSVRVGGPGGTPTPDYDQKRTGLENEGRMHCVPTCFANMMGYYALNGSPTLFPGADEAEWANYGTITDNIEELGVLMSTDPGGGTGAQGWFDGGRAWMDERGGPPHTYTQSLGITDVTPEGMWRVLQLGGTAGISYGRYQEIGSSGVWRWGGGHAVTLDRVDKLCQGTAIGNWSVHYRDPASSEDPINLDAQSAYATTQRAGRVVNVTFETDEGNQTLSAFEMVILGSDTRRFWYKMTALTPEFHLRRPFTFGTTWRWDPSIVYQAGQPVLDFDPGPIDEIAPAGQPGIVMVLRSQANGGLTPVRLAAWDVLNDVLLASVPLVGADALMCVGRRGQVHVFNNGLVRAFRFVGGDTPSWQELGTPRSVASTAGEYVAMGFDDRRDEVLLLRSDRLLTRIAVNRHGAVNGALTSLSLPANPGFAAEGKVRVFAGWGDGEDYWIGPMTASAIGGPATVRRFSRDATSGVLNQVEVLSPPLPPAGSDGTWTHATPISDWMIGDSRRMLLQRSGQMQELRRGIINWGSQTQSPWFGKATRGGAYVTRSRDMRDRSLPEPAFWNLLNPDVSSNERSDCNADIGTTGGVPGADGLLNNNDFVVFIDWFFLGKQAADRGTTGGVSGHDGLFNNNDFVVFIDEFFGGC